MDFVTDLPVSADWKGNRYNPIFVILNCLTKMRHYEPVKIMIDALGQDKVILDVVVQHHGLLDSIVTNKNLFFTSKF